MAFRPDGECLVILFRHGIICILDPCTLAERRRAQLNEQLDHRLFLSLSCSTDAILVGYMDGALHVFDGNFTKVCSPHFPGQGVFAAHDPAGERIAVVFRNAENLSCLQILAAASLDLLHETRTWFTGDACLCYVRGGAQVAALHTGAKRPLRAMTASAPQDRL
jgi:hypothetical protein